MLHSQSSLSIRCAAAPFAAIVRTTLLLRLRPRGGTAFCASADRKPAPGASGGFLCQLPIWKCTCGTGKGLRLIGDRICRRTGTKNHTENAMHEPPSITGVISMLSIGLSVLSGSNLRQDLRWIPRHTVSRNLHRADEELLRDPKIF